MYYGIPFGMSYKIDESAQLSTLKNADGTPVNLFEQELAALRVTMDVAFMIVKDEAFVKLEAGASQLGLLQWHLPLGLLLVIPRSQSPSLKETEILINIKLPTLQLM